MKKKTIYGFVKIYKNPRTPPRHFLYDRKANRDAGVKLAKPGGKLPPNLKRIDKYTDKVIR